MTSRASRVLSAALLASLLSGCGYVRNRLRDLHEVFLFDVQLGVGLGFDVKVGPLDAPLGLGTWAPWTVGKPTWWDAPRAFDERNSYFPGNLVTGEIRFQELVKREPGDDGDLLFRRESIWGIANLLIFGVQSLLEDPDERVRVGRELGPRANRDDRDDEPARISRRRRRIDQWGGVEAGVFAGAVGARAGINLAELGDFLVGLFGADLLEDDD